MGFVLENVSICQNSLTQNLFFHWLPFYKWICIPAEILSTIVIKTHFFYPVEIIIHTENQSPPQPVCVPANLSTCIYYHIVCFFHGAKGKCDGTCKHASRKEALSQHIDLWTISWGKYLSLEEMGEWSEFHSGKLHNLFSSPNVVSPIILSHLWGHTWQK
jgi:hypothetical protein